MLELSGVVEVTVEGSPVRVEAAGRELRVSAERPAALLRHGGLRMLRAAQPVLERLGLTVRVTYRGRQVAMAGAGAGAEERRRWLRWWGRRAP